MNNPNQSTATAAPAEAVTVQTIDITPTWGDMGVLAWRLAVSKEVKALRAMKADFAQAFACAEALKQIANDLPEELAEKVRATLAREQRKVNAA